MDINQAEPAGFRKAFESSKLIRFLVVGAVFLAYQATLIGVFGEYFFAANGSPLLLWSMVGLTAAGYLALGTFSGSWASIFLLAAPPLMASAFDVQAPVEPGTETLDLDQMFVFFSVFYVAAWGFGAVVLASLMRGIRRGKS